VTVVAGLNPACGAEALEYILTGLDENDRVTAVMACATGKTLVSLWLAESRKAKRVLVLVPSLALIRQTLHEWLKETAWERTRFIAVAPTPRLQPVLRTWSSSTSGIWISR
jgi:predicted helicase